MSMRHEHDILSVAIKLRQLFFGWFEKFPGICCFFCMWIYLSSVFDMNLSDLMFLSRFSHLKMKYRILKELNSVFWKIFEHRPFTFRESNRSLEIE